MIETRRLKNVVIFIQIMLIIWITISFISILFIKVFFALILIELYILLDFSQLLFFNLPGGLQ